MLAAVFLLATDATVAEQPGDESTLIYPASFFAQYEPVSVDDMLSRIPGISLVLDESTDSGLRGLGAGENEIMIDGRRVAGKENEGRAQLSRIAASSVDHIEIIRSTSGDMDVRSSGLIVNIVLNETKSRHNVAAELNLLRYPDTTVNPGGLISLSGQRNDLSYLVSLEAASFYEYRIGREYSVLGDHSRNDSRPRVEIRDEMSYTASSTIAYNLGERDTVHLNGLYRDDDPPVRIDRTITDFTVTPVTTARQREVLDATGSNWELGGDYSHKAGDGDRYKLLFIVNDSRYDSVRNRYTTPEGGNEAHDLYLLSNSRNRERIVRTSWTAGLGERQELEVGVERAQTILDTKLLLGVAGTGTPSPQVGGFIQIPVANSISTVEEIRYEVFAVHDWHIGTRASLESSLVAEFSEIAQTADVYNSRNFRFLRPKLDYRFDVTQQLQIRASITRHVSQLSFAEFAAAVDAMDDDSNSISGNPELVQEKSWQYDFRIEYRLADDGGVWNAHLFYQDIEDVIDTIDTSTSPAALDSAPGNIGDGRRYGFDLNGSLRLDFVDMPNALLTAALRVERSRVTDPFLGVERPLPMRGRGNARLGFQHDLPARGINYGFNYIYPLHGDLMIYDIDTIEDYETDPTMTMFLEKATSRGITYRLESINTFRGYRCRIRTRYDGATWDGMVAEIEDACSTPGHTIAFKVRGNF